MASIEKFLATKGHSVVGASARTHKDGYKGFKALLAAFSETYPPNSVTEEIEYHQAYPSISDLTLIPESLSIIMSPEFTRQEIADAIAAGV